MHVHVIFTLVYRLQTYVTCTGTVHLCERKGIFVSVSTCKLGDTIRSDVSDFEKEQRIDKIMKMLRHLVGCLKYQKV